VGNGAPRGAAAEPGARSPSAQLPPELALCRHLLVRGESNCSLVSSIIPEPLSPEDGRALPPLPCPLQQGGFCRSCVIVSSSARGNRDYLERAKHKSAGKTRDHLEGDN